MEITPVAAIREFFSTPAKPVTFTELKELGAEAIKELAPDCAKALGKELKMPE